MCEENRQHGPIFTRFNVTDWWLKLIEYIEHKLMQLRSIYDKTGTKTTRKRERKPRKWDKDIFVIIVKTTKLMKNVEFMAHC